MKKIKKAYGKGAVGIKHLGTAAIKTIINAPLSQNEKATLHHLQGRDQSAIETATIVVHQTSLAAAANPPSFEEVMGAQNDIEPNE
jgi:hypothetical protein